MKSIKSILFLTDNFPPEVNAPATRTFEHAKVWVENGYSVTVITCAPNFPHGKVYEGYQNKFMYKENIDGIKVIRVWTYITANEGFIKRIIDYISFGLMSLFVGLFVKADIIVATTPQFFTAVSGRWLAFFKRKPWVMEVRDLWPESIAAVGAMKKGRIYNILESVELSLYKSANKIIVVTDAFKEKIAQRGISHEKIKVHKNGVLLDRFIPGPKNSKLLRNYPQLQDKTIFGYIGTLGMAHGLKFIINALPKIQANITNAHFLFIGEGAEKDNLIAQANELKLENITFIPFVSKREVVDYLNLMDVALVNLKKSDTFKLVIPSKLFEAAALEKPILLGLEGESKIILEDYNAGIAFLPEDEEDFVEKCSKILDDKNYQNFMEGCRSLVKDFDRSKIALQMLETIVSVD